jgi:hypothetical protein
MRWLAEQGDIEDLLIVATEIERRLQGDKFRDWIHATIGELPKVNPDLPKAIDQLGAPVATTNYDDFPAQIAQCGTVTWLDRPDIDQWLKRSDRRHYHLHGVWQRAETLILGHSSYGRLTADHRTQFVQRVLGTRRLLLIGYGAGLSDPNLGPLIGWLREELSGGNRNDYLLCLEAEADQEGHFVRVPFGRSYADLERFLFALAPLKTRHQPLIDIASAYEFASEDTDVQIQLKNKLIEDLGRSIAAAASTELYDALEDWRDGLGLPIGLIKAITIQNEHDEIGRVLAIAARLPDGNHCINSRCHVLEALVTLCPAIHDPSIRQRVKSLMNYWSAKADGHPLFLNGYGKPPHFSISFHEFLSPISLQTAAHAVS